jgi:hypothetical protein
MNEGASERVKGSGCRLQEERRIISEQGQSARRHNNQAGQAGQANQAKLCEESLATATTQLVTNELAFYGFSRLAFGLPLTFPTSSLLLSPRPPQQPLKNHSAGQVLRGNQSHIMPSSS